MTDREIDNWVKQGRQFTATVKCNASRGGETERYVGIASTYLEAIKAAIAKAEEVWDDGGDQCYSVEVHPQPEPQVGCSNKGCPPGRGGYSP